MRKAFLFILLLVLINFASPGRVFAADYPCAGEPVTSYCNTSLILGNNIKAMNILLIGSPDNPKAARQSLVNSLLSGIGLMIATPPVSGRDYVTYMSNRFHVPGTPSLAYAAEGGTGYNSLTPVLRIWTATRNIAYFFFAIMFVVAGLMIMFRLKIDPKTAANIQNSLPKIIVALIVVTFSYAIAGFLIDILYISLNLILAIIQSMGFGDIAGDLRYGLSNQPLLNFIVNGNMGAVITSAATAVGTALDSLTGNLPVAGGILQLVTSGIAAFIVAVAVLIAVFKAWIMLITAYAQIILGIIFAPLQLMLDALPGQNQLGTWIRNMLANILSFPAVLVMLFLGMALGTNMGRGVSGGLGSPADITSYSGFVPPFIGGNNLSAVQSFIGLGILLTIPKTLEMLQQVLKTPQFKFGNAWMEAAAGGAAIPKGVGTAGVAAGLEATGSSNIPVVGWAARQIHDRGARSKAWNQKTW